MSHPSRPISRWSTSMSTTTKSSNVINQTTPLLNVRKKLFRQSINKQKSLAQRMDKSKHDMEELFKLYYSNDIKFDTFERQIVTGKRIPTARTSISPQNHRINSSTVFYSKHCVSREQLGTPYPDCNAQQPINNETTTKQSIPILMDNNSTINHHPVPSSNLNLSPQTVIDVNRNLPETSSLTQQDELCDSPLVKSVTFLGEISNNSNENINTKQIQSNNIEHPISSKSTLLSAPPDPPPPSLLVMNTNNNRKGQTILSYTSFSPMTSIEQPPTIVTGSAVTVRQRSPTKQSWNRQRTKSNITMTTNLSSPQSTTIKARSPSITSRVSVQPDMPDLPVFVGTQRVVSIPSKCSRYVLVTFPEVPLRYNAPSYVERLLLPERFPKLFQNIIQSYDHHLTTSNIQHHRNTK